MNWPLFLTAFLLLLVAIWAEGKWRKAKKPRLLARIGVLFAITTIFFLVAFFPLWLEHRGEAALGMVALSLVLVFQTELGRFAMRLFLRQDEES